MGRSTHFGENRCRRDAEVLTLWAMSTIRKLSVLAFALGIVVAPAAVHAADLDATGSVLRFGYDGQTVTDSSLLDTVVPVGTALVYENVATIGTTAIDAVVTYADGANLVGDCDVDSTPGSIGRIDDTFPSDEEDPFIEASICVAGDPNTDRGYAVLTIDFYIGGTYAGEGTGTPANMTNLLLNVYDIDDLQAMEVPGVIGYSVSTNTHLTVTEPADGTYLFQAPETDTSTSDGTAYTIGRAKVALAPTSSVSVTLSTDADSDASFDLDFSGGAAWTDTVGGGEDTTNLPPVVEEEEETLPVTGGMSTTLLAAALGTVLIGSLLTRVNRRRTA